MKAITLQQPWATLSVTNAKRIETRSWNTQHRGTLLIHAGKAKPKINRELAATEPFISYINTGTILPFNEFDLLPFGYIIGMVDIIDTMPTSAIISELPKVIHAGGHTWKISNDEINFGDYGPGRYAWLMANCVKFERPIPYRGKLSLWDYEPIAHRIQSEKPVYHSQPLTLAL